ncbi:MAG: hypothetical protein O7G85_03430 [Planctomycetota bacterium]|nr:hypothetical protein [Planctomycetota bacterium]
MKFRLGQVLIEEGVLTSEQVTQILENQKQTGEPFGLLCERVFGISPETIEDAWALQYARLTRSIDPLSESFDDKARALITRRQAWQFCILPIRFDGQELMIATSQKHLRRALRFATNVIGMPVYFVMAEPVSLGEALCRHYELPGMNPASVHQSALDRFFPENDRAAA